MNIETKQYNTLKLFQVNLQSVSKFIHNYKLGHLFYCTWIIIQLYINYYYYLRREESDAVTPLTGSTEKHCAIIIIGLSAACKLSFGGIKLPEVETTEDETAKTLLGE